MGPPIRLRKHPTCQFYRRIMLIPKKNRLAIYRYLFKEGVLVAKKDLTMKKHPRIEVPNVQVIKLMTSLKSRGFIKEKFSWQYLYYSLTNHGIDYLREYLHVSGETVPATLRKPVKNQPPPSFSGSRGRGRGRGGRGGRGGREGYRDGGKPMGAPSGFDPQYGEGRGGRGGFRGGRGGGFRGRRGGF